LIEHAVILGLLRFKDCFSWFLVNLHHGLTLTFIPIFHSLRTYFSFSSALDRLKKPWSKAMEADDTEGRHRLVLEGADASKKAAEDKAAVKEAAAADAADKAESESSGNGNGNKLKEDTKKQEKKAGPVKLAGFADPKPVGASPSKKIEEEIKNKNAKDEDSGSAAPKTESTDKEAAPSKDSEDSTIDADAPKQDTSKPEATKEQESKCDTDMEDTGRNNDSASAPPPTPASAASGSNGTHSDEDNDAAEALQAIMQLGGSRQYSVASGDAPKTKSPSKMTNKTFPLPTKRSREPEGTAASPAGSASFSPNGLVPLSKEGDTKKMQGPPLKKRKVPGEKAGEKMKKVKGEKIEKNKKIKGEGKKKVKCGNGKKPQALPEILMDLLNKNVAPDAIFWLPGQQIFLINKENFKKKVIPKYFNGKTFTSITKSLNLWNFTKAPKAQLPPNTVGYHHKLFQKDAPHLLKEMVNGGGAGDPNSKNNDRHPLPGSGPHTAAAKKSKGAETAGRSPAASQPNNAAAAAGLATLGELAASAAPAQSMDPQQAELEALQSRSLQLAAEREALMQSMFGQQQNGGDPAIALEMLRQRQASLGNPEFGTGGLSELDLLRERAAASGDTATLDMLRAQQQGGGDYASLLELAEQQRNAAMERAIAERMMLEREMAFGGGGNGYGGGFGGDHLALQMAQLRAQQGGGMDPMMMHLLRQRQQGTAGGSDQTTLELLRQRQQDEAMEAENALAEQQRTAALERMLLERELGALGGGGGGGGLTQQQQNDLQLQLAQLRGGQGGGGGGVDPMMLWALRQQQEFRDNGALEELMLLEQQRRQQDALRAFMSQRGDGGK